MVDARFHGGVDDTVARAHGVDPACVIDFSVNLNPYGPCEPVLRAARAAELGRYPDSRARAARAAWAEVLACDPAELAVGHGAADLLWAIARALTGPGTRAVIAEPTFSEFGVAVQAAGAAVTRVVAAREQLHRLDLDRIAEAAQGANALYLCTPNNPTGEYTDPTRLAALAARVPETVLVIDQSFLGLSPYARDARAELPANVIRVRSLTKEFACPGLRIGLCRAHPSLIARIEAQRPSWATSSPALAALAVSAGQGDFVRRSFERMREDRDALTTMLRARGFAPLPSETSYQLVPLPPHWGSAATLTAALLRRGVQVRDCSSFGLPDCIRLAALPEPARRALQAALDAALGA